MTNHYLNGLFLSLIITFSCQLSFAQSPTNRLALVDSLLTNQAFESLDTSDFLNTGVLWDRIYPHENLLAYQGEIDSDTAEGMTGFQVYLDLFRSQVDTTNLLSYDSVRQVYQSQKHGFDALPIITFAYQYQYLKPEALDSGYIAIVDSQLAITNSNVNPFETKTIHTRPK